MRTLVVSSVLALSLLVSDVAIAEPPLLGRSFPLAPGMFAQVPEPSSMRSAVHAPFATEISGSFASPRHSRRNLWIIPVAFAVYILVLYATSPRT